MGFRKCTQLETGAMSQTPQPQPDSKCHFCGGHHPLKQICRERLEAMQQARRQRSRPLHHGRDRVERTR
jgi:hypothetical protein